MPFPEFLRLCWKIGWHSLGGPAAQIELLHQEFATKRTLVSESEFQHALGFCTLIPGPEAQQLATYIGFILHGTRGALTAGGLFILPGALCMALWCLLYVSSSDYDLTQWILAVFRPAALGLILAAVFRMASRLPRTPSSLLGVLLAGSALAMHLLPFPAIVLLAAIYGSLQTPPAQSPTVAPQKTPPLTSTLRIGSVGLLLWIVPIAIYVFLLGYAHPLAQLGLLLAKNSLTTFGGAYATLPYVATAAVESHGWFSHQAMLDGLALGETTPGPLLLVLQFYGFLTGWNAPTPATPLLAGVLGMLIALWTTFIPSFIWVLTGAPWATVLLRLPRLRSALAMITVALVGSLIHLGWTLTRLTLWIPAHIPWFSIALTLGVLVWRLWPKRARNGAGSSSFNAPEAKSSKTMAGDHSPPAKSASATRGRSP